VMVMNISEQIVASIIKRAGLNAIHKGYPDFTLYKDHEIKGFIEVKSNKAGLRPEQEIFKKLLSDVGMCYSLINVDFNETGVDKIEETIRGDWWKHKIDFNLEMPTIDDEYCKSFKVPLKHYARKLDRFINTHPQGYPMKIEEYRDYCQKEGIDISKAMIYLEKRMANGDICEVRNGEYYSVLIDIDAIMQGT